MDIIWDDKRPNVFWHIERGTEAIECKKCHGFAERVDCTAEECATFTCGRDSPGRECCARAFVCKACGQRYAGKQAAPEME